MFIKRLFSNEENLITLSLSYYNDGANLSGHIEEFKKYPKNLKIQIIDDGSIEDPITDYLSIIPKNVDIFRIEEDIPWNIPGSRNLSATVATTPWLLILDMDQIISLENMKKILNLPLNNPYKYFSFNRKIGSGTKFTAGTMLVSRKAWWSCGGYDEDLVGNYGHNDPLFRHKLNRIGASEKRLKNIWVRQIDADCRLSRDGENKNKEIMMTKKNEDIANEKLRFNWKKIN
jgi:predicted glycosyltransferase involved in capsule biosynthesis